MSYRLSKILNNKILIYVFSRYLSYFIQFLNSIIIAYKIGPFFLGIWGFVSLIIQYISFGNLGIDYAVNVKLSTGKNNDRSDRSDIISNSLFSTGLTCILFIIVGISIRLLNLELFTKFNFTPYIILTVLIGCVNFFNSLFVNIYRTYSIFTPISLFQIIIQLLQLPVLFVFHESQMIYSLLVVILLGHIISFAFFVYKFPIKINININFSVIRKLYGRGIMLLFYNISFYLLLLSTRTLISILYSVETMGLFTFASNIASALILGLGSLEFVVFPKMLNRLSENVTNERAYHTIKEIRGVYIISVYLLIILGLLFYPLLLIFFDKYIGTYKLFSLLVVCQIIIACGFGYSTILISRGRELYLAFQAIVAIVINLGLSIVGFKIFNLDYSFMAVFLVISFLYYEVQVIRKGRKLIGLDISFKEIYNEVFPLKLFFPFILILVGIFSEEYRIFYLLGLLSFLSLNFKGFNKVISFVKTLVKEPDIISIN